MPTHYHGTPEEIRALDTWIKLTRAVDSSGRGWPVTARAAM